LPRLLVDEIKDIVIIGGGIAGLSVAKAAVEAGLTVEVIEKGTICGQGAPTPNPNPAYP